MTENVVAADPIFSVAQISVHVRITLLLLENRLLWQMVLVLES
jgi:hypothetical protein